jgi:hypothetical protein
VYGAYFFNLHCLKGNISSICKTNFSRLETNIAGVIEEHHFWVILLIHRFVPFDDIRTAQKVSFVGLKTLSSKEMTVRTVDGPSIAMKITTFGTTSCSSTM